MLAVPAEIERFVLRTTLVGEVDIHFLQVGRTRRFRVVDLHLHLGNHGQQVTHIRLHTSLVQGGRGRGLGFFLRGKEGQERQK